MRLPLRERTRNLGTQIAHKTYSFAEVGEEMYRRLQTIDDESKDAEDPKDRTNYTREFTRKRCLEIVTASATRAKITSGRITRWKPPKDPAGPGASSTQDGETRHLQVNAEGVNSLDDP